MRCESTRERRAGTVDSSAVLLTAAGVLARRHGPASCRGLERRVHAPTPREPGDHRALDRARPPIDRRAGRVGGRLDQRRHRRRLGVARAGRSQRSARGSSLREPTAAGKLAVAFAGLRAEADVDRASRLGHRPVAVPQRRPARPHQGGLQHRQMPRLGLGQGWISPLAVRIRPRGRPLPPDPRGDRPADRPRRARRVPAPEQGDGPGLAHRRQADRTRQRGLSADPGVARGGGAGRPSRRAPSRSAIEVLPARRRLRARPPRPSAWWSGPATPTAPTATSPGSRSSSATTTRPSRWTSRGWRWVGGPGEAFVLARFDKFTAGTADHRAARHAVRSPGTPAFNEIDTLVHAKLDRLHVVPSEVCSDETFLRRRLHRPDRPAADRRGAGAFPGRPLPGTTRGPGRSPDGSRRIPRHLGDEVGRAAPDPHGQRAEPQGPPAVRHLAPRACPRRGDDRSDRPRAPARHGRELREPRRQLLPDRDHAAADRRERRPGLPRHPDPVRPVPQPSVRSLDDGRLLRVRRVLQPDRLQAGPGPARADRLQRRLRRGEAPPGRPDRAAHLPGRGQPRGSSPARTTAPSWPTGSPRPRTRPSPGTSPTSIWAHFFGQGIIEPVDDAACQQSAQQSRAARNARETPGRHAVRHQAADPRDPPQPDLPA